MLPASRSLSAMASLRCPAACWAPTRRANSTVSSANGSGGSRRSSTAQPSDMATKNGAASLGDLLQRLQGGVEPGTGQVNLATSEREYSGEMLGRSRQLQETRRKRVELRRFDLCASLQSPAMNVSNARWW